MSTTTSTTPIKQTAPAGALTLTRAALAAALSTVAEGVAKRPAMPVLGNILVDCGKRDVTLTALNYDVAVTVTLEGAATAPGRMLVEFASLTRTLAAVVKGERKAAADATPVTIATTDGTPVLSAAGYVIPLEHHAVEDFPALPSTTPATHVVDREAFTAATKRVAVAASRDETLPLLMALLLDLDTDGIRLAATDRYRLAMERVPATGTSADSVPVPARPLSRLLSRMDGAQLRVGIDITTDGTWVTWTSDTITASIRTVSGDFPPVARLFPDVATITVTVDRGDLAKATTKAAAITTASGDRHHGVRLAVSSTGITIAPTIEGRQHEVRAPEVAADVDSAHTGTDAWITGANQQYLTELLTAFTDDTITLHLGSPGKPMTFTTGGAALTDVDGYRQLLMPLRLP